MTYRVTVAPGVQAALAHFDRGLQHRIAGKIDACVTDPFSTLTSIPGTDLRTVHVGDWRLIARVDKAETNVLVLALRPLGPPARGLP
ncbi:MAG: hypothetical protein FJX35_12450 [Alphaproteobacteria bacterium]|nr:hypothetical protein [Alphaproteobacteria bacterium]